MDVPLSWLSSRWNAKAAPLDRLIAYKLMLLPHKFDVRLLLIGKYTQAVDAQLWLPS